MKIWKDIQPIKYKLKEPLGTICRPPKMKVIDKAVEKCVLLYYWWVYKLVQWVREQLGDNY